MFKQLGIAIGIMIVLIIIIVLLSGKKKEGYNASPYQILDYVNNRNALNSSIPIPMKR